MSILTAVVVLASCNTVSPELNAGDTPMMKAVQSGDAKALSHLLATDKSGLRESSAESLLSVAFRTGKGDMDVVNALLAAGAVVGEDEVRMATYSCYPQYLQAALNAGGRVPRGSSDAKGSIFAEFAYADDELRDGSGRDCVACAKLLLAAGARTDDGDVSPLHYAVCGDKTELARYFLSMGLDVNARDSQGDTPLMYHIKGTDMVQLLLAAGADAQAQNKDGNNAAMNNQLSTEVVAALLRAGLNPNQTNNKGETVLMYHLNHPRMVSGTYYDESNNITGTWSGDSLDMELVQLLIDAGADVNRTDNTGRTPIQAAGAHPEVCKQLRRAGAK